MEDAALHLELSTISKPRSADTCTTANTCAEELSSWDSNYGLLSVASGTEPFPNVGNWEDSQGESEGEGADESDPHAQGLGGDIPSAVLGIIKAMVGPAILYLPHGFANCGWFLSIPILLLATFLFLGSSSALLESWKLESTKGFDKLENIGLASSACSAEETGSGVVIRKAFVLSYPELANRAMGSSGESIVKVGIALMQSGVCLTYLIFVPLNLRTSTQMLFGWDIPAAHFLVIMLLFEIPLSWIQDIRRLTVTNLVANVLILYGLVTCLGFAFTNAIDSEVGRGPVVEVAHKLMDLDAFKDGWFLFIGTSVLLFEGSITLLVPLQEAVHSEEDRRRFPFVYKRVILGIISFYIFFGITCWMSFGGDVNTVMTTSLPGGLMATTVQLAYSFAVIFTFPLQNFPTLEIACRSIASVLQNFPMFAKYPFLQNRKVISSEIVILLALVALCTMERLDKVVSLTGSLLGCPLAFVFPPLIHNKLDPNLPRSRALKNNAIAACGIVAMILASVTTILTWNQSKNEP